MSFDELLPHSANIGIKKQEALELLTFDKGFNIYIVTLMKETTTPPWGRWTVLEDNIDFKVKKIEVLPGKRLSYQRHFKRSEHWMVVKGRAKVTLDGKEIFLDEGNYIDIPKQALHRIENVGGDLLIFIEIQRGTYLGEDDIIRVEDDYGRI